MSDEISYSNLSTSYNYYNYYSSTKNMMVIKGNPNGLIGWNDTLKDCEQFLKASYCDSFETAIGFIARHLNLSLISMSSKLDSSETIALSLCTNCYTNPSNFKNPGSNLIVHRNEKVKFMYCQSTAELEKPHLDFLWAPFDSNIWLALIFAAISFTCIFKDTSYFINIFRLLINQPPSTMRHNLDFRCWVFTFSCVVFLVVNFTYQGVITRDVTIVLQPSPIKTLKSLFITHGFRFVIDVPDVDNKSALAPPEAFKIKGINYSKDLYMENLDKSAEPVPHYAGEATTILGSLGGPMFMFNFKIKYPHLTCAVVDETFYEIWDTFIFWSNLSQKVYSMMRNIHSSGINFYWENNYRFRDTLPLKFKVEEKSSVKPLSFETTIYLVFLLYVLLVCICVGVFIGELCKYYFTSRIQL